MSITNTIKSIQDIMRKDVGVDGDAQRIGQLVWMLFLKIYDTKELEWELLDDHYQSPIPEPYRWRNWAADAEGITGEELKSFIDNELFPSLQSLEPKGDDQRAYVVKNAFGDAYNYMKSGQLIRQLINKIEEGVDYTKAQQRHLFGDMYEQLLRDLQNAGNAGEFYTPRAVTEFIVNRVDPKLNETVLDPACGTGGFLTCAIEHTRKKYAKTADDEKVLQASIKGFEKKPLPHLLATTNMILHGIEVPSNIKHDNTLARPLINGWTPKDRVDVIITNPPFGGNEEEGIENNFPQTLRTRETADLFMALITHLLKDGGRAAVVLPDGFLFGEGMKTRLKEKLLSECNLHTIVRLPNGVFNPYTSIKTNLLFFTKGKPTETVWFYEHPYPAGYKSYSKTKPMKFDEFQTEIDWWGIESDGFATREANDQLSNESTETGEDEPKKLVKNNQAWKVSIDEIKVRNYNLDIKNPYVAEQISHDPDELLEQYTKEKNDLKGLKDELLDLLNAAISKAEA